jgi:hypothetical protein
VALVASEGGIGQALVMAQDRGKRWWPDKCAVSCRHTEIRANFARFVHQQMRKRAALVTVCLNFQFLVKNAIYALCKYIRI